MAVSYTHLDVYKRQVKSRFDYHMYSNTVDRDGRKMVEIGYTLRSRGAVTYNIN